MSDRDTHNPRTQEGANERARADAARYKGDRRNAKMEQKDRLRAQQIQKLREMAVQAANAGAMAGALPQINDNMSDADIAKAAQSIARYIPKTTAAPKAESAPAAAKAAITAPLVAQPAAPATPAAVAPARTGMGDKQLAEAQATGQAPVATPAPANNAANTPSRAALLNQPAAAPAAPAPSALAPAGANPLEQLAADMKNALVARGVLAPGQKLMKTGAGYVTPAIDPVTGAQMTNPDGSPRTVAIQPNLEDIMNAKTGGAYRGWSPEQRAAYFRLRPGAHTEGTNLEGEVTDAGAGAFNTRGERIHGQKTLDTGSGNMRTPGGDRRKAEAIEYDPRMDSMKPQDIAAKYGTPGAVNGITTPGVITDASGNQYDPATGKISKAQPAPPAPPNPMTAKAPAAGRSGSSDTAIAMAPPPVMGMGDVKAAEAGIAAPPPVGGAPQAVGLASMVPKNPGTNLPGPAGSAGIANALAPKPATSAVTPPAPGSPVDPGARRTEEIKKKLGTASGGMAKAWMTLATP